MQVYLVREERWQLPPFLQGLESQTFSTGTSHSDAENPTGQEHCNIKLYLINVILKIKNTDITYTTKNINIANLSIMLE